MFVQQHNTGNDHKIKKKFQSYKPAVSHGDTKKIIRIKRAGNKYLEDLAMLRMDSKPDDGGEEEEEETRRG